jgi:hypothetical protein
MLPANISKLQEQIGGNQKGARVDFPRPRFKQFG